MCTASWAPGPDGYSFCFNRDERRTRAPALPPAEREQDGVRFVAPLDGDFGGTWIAVTTLGLTFGLLNRYRDTAVPEPEDLRSRGLLIPELVSAPDLMTVASRLERMDLERYRPFSLLAVAPGHPALISAWDGRTLRLQRHAQAGLLLTSSAVDQPEVAESRARIFAAVPEVTPAALESIHRSHSPERSGRSVCMHRPDAQTQSYTRATVTPLSIALHHTDSSPCERTAPISLTLPRHNPSLAAR